MIEKNIINTLIVSFVILMLPYNLIVAQNYSFFNLSRTVEKKDNCQNPPPGQRFILPANIYLKLNPNGFFVKKDPKSTPYKISLSQEEMLRGVYMKDVFNDYRDAIDLSNTCHDDILKYVSIAPSNLNIKLTTPTTGENNDNSTGDIVTLSATKGYNPLVYNWQFLTEKNNLFKGEQNFVLKHFDNYTVSQASKGDFSFKSMWRNFPLKFLGKDTITFTAEDLFGEYAELLIGKSVKFRIRMSNGWVSDEIFSFVFIPGSPKLRSIVLEEPICNYSNDNKFTISVSRKLIEGEKLILSFFDKNTITLQEEVDMLYKDEEGNYSFSWNLNIPPGDYKIKYQTYTKDEDSQDIDWATIEFSGNIKVFKPKPLKFKVKKLNGENCFKSGDGKIEIYDVEGEKNRKFLYKIDKVNGANLKSIRDWTVFTGNSVIVEKLGSIGLGKYRIQVKDEKDCFFRDPE